MPEWYQALGYETARVLLAAVEQAGSADRDAVRMSNPLGRIPALVLDDGETLLDSGIYLIKVVDQANLAA